MSTGVHDPFESGEPFDIARYRLGILKPCAARYLPASYHDRQIGPYWSSNGLRLQMVAGPSLTAAASGDRHVGYLGSEVALRHFDRRTGRGLHGQGYTGIVGVPSRLRATTYFKTDNLIS